MRLSSRARWTNPADRAERPAPDDSRVGMVLDEEHLTKLVQGFRCTALYGIVAVGAVHGLLRASREQQKRFMALDTALSLDAERGGSSK